MHARCAQAARFGKVLETYWKIRGCAEGQGWKRISRVSKNIILNWAFLDHAFRVFRGRLPR